MFRRVSGDVQYLMYDAYAGMMSTYGRFHPGPACPLSVDTIEKIPLRENICFYDAKDWWPTYYLINSLKAKLFDPDREVCNIAMSMVIIQQMAMRR